jgi:hypothetical protein
VRAAGTTRCPGPVRGTKRDAEKVLTQIQAQIDQGGATRGGDVTVAELLVEWLDMIEGDRSPSTMQSHRSKGVTSKAYPPGWHSCGRMRSVPRWAGLTLGVTGLVAF